MLNQDVTRHAHSTYLFLYHHSSFHSNVHSAFRSFDPAGLSTFHSVCSLYLPLPISILLRAYETMQNVKNGASIPDPRRGHLEHWCLRRMCPTRPSVFPSSRRCRSRLARARLQRDAPSSSKGEGVGTASLADVRISAPSYDRMLSYVIGTLERSNVTHDGFLYVCNIPHYLCRISIVLGVRPLPRWPRVCCAGRR